MKIIVLLAVSSVLQTLWAGGGITPSDTEQKTNYYMIAKAFNGTGAVVNGIEGQDIYGGAFDIGIKPARWHHFSLELNTAYAEGTGIPTGAGKKAAVKEDLTFRGLGFTLVYTHHFKGFSLFGKGGYKYEQEKVEEPGHAVKTLEGNGLLYAAGIEFPLPGHWELLVEIEDVVFDTTMGPELMLGVKVPFK
jgi:hypothetical protein